ncbi:hypothetical protein RBH29_06600 [Herbivorax sp. ANBcel31]|uniref:hypothetical protein n=1 Tax=Herbivorax sp. ANBcel31 TaxID=3069754 RepID=UPI0027B05B3E|nr:hypothetical protein [Herbivorax sp. ANBcel31]MDQ2086102.1 hypothetical protein [Herbivorax sp. ANBcel31]
MLNNLLMEKLISRDASVTMENVLCNSKSSSGGEEDLNFLKCLIDNKLLEQEEKILKRTNIDFNEALYEEKYPKMKYESSRHYFCRAIIQDELQKLGISTTYGSEAGNLNILRTSSNYDITAEDLSFLIDIGLTPARNYFKGLTDFKVKNYLISTYFDDYMDEIIFCSLKRNDDESFLEAVKNYTAIN